MCLGKVFPYIFYLSSLSFKTDLLKEKKKEQNKIKKNHHKLKVRSEKTIVDARFLCYNMTIIISLTLLKCILENHRLMFIAKINNIS